MSIVAHLLLIVRFGRGFPYFRSKSKGVWQRCWTPCDSPDLYCFFCTTMWFAWETVRYNLLPKPNAWMVAIAATCWYLTEITGEISNIGIGTVSDIAFRIVWIFYGTNVLLLALSGYRWTKN